MFCLRVCQHMSAVVLGGFANTPDPRVWSKVFVEVTQHEQRKPNDQPHNPYFGHLIRM